MLLSSNKALPFVVGGMLTLGSAWRSSRVAAATLPPARARDRRLVVGSIGRVARRPEGRRPPAARRPRAARRPPAAPMQATKPAAGARSRMARRAPPSTTRGTHAVPERLLLVPRHAAVAAAVVVVVVAAAVAPRRRARSAQLCGARSPTECPAPRSTASAAAMGSARWGHRRDVRRNRRTRVHVVVPRRSRAIV